MFTTDIARPYPKTKSSSAPMEKKTIEGRRSLHISLASKDIHMSFKQQQKNIFYLYFTPFYEIVGTQNNNNVTCNIICLGITEKQPETFVNTETKFHKEFTFGTQSDSQRGQHPIKGNH